MLTLFTTTKPFVNQNAIIQKNALKSWKQLDENIEIIVFGDEPGTKEVTQDLGIIHVPDIKTNEYGTPLLNDLFFKAREISKFDFNCYINADILLTKSFISSFSQLEKKYRQFLLVGRRWDLDIDHEIDFSEDWQSKYLQQLNQSGKLYSIKGMDYFVYHKKMWQDIPPFAIGRTAWDNWLIFEARRLGVKVIDATGSITAIHQNHDWSHIKGGKEMGWTGPESIKNREYAKEKEFDIYHSTHILHSNILLPAIHYSIINMMRIHLLKIGICVFNK